VIKILCNDTVGIVKMRCIKNDKYIYYVKVLAELYNDKSILMAE